MTAYAELMAPRRRNTGAIWGIFLVGGAILLGQQVAKGGSMVRVAVALCVMLVLAIPAVEQPRKAIQALFVVLPILGIVRHAFLSATGAAFLDPLLLISSAVVLMIWTSLLLNREVDFEGTGLSKLVFLLLIVGAIQVFNPGQGNLLVGLTGVMINLIPVSLFFIGRSISDAEFTHRIVKIAIGIGVAGAVYGLVQVFVGFRGFEIDWIKTQGAYNAAKVGETYRPFSFFNNPSEYAAYAHIAFVLAFAWFLFSPRTKRTMMLAAVAMLAYGGFLIGSRGFTVKVALAIIVLMAARARNRVLATGVIMILVTGVVWWSATTSSDSTIQEKEAGAAQLTEQQFRALSDPFNREKSTLPIHFDQAHQAITESIRTHPWGLGTGVATRGGAKFSGKTASSELDIGDAFLAFGVIGGGLYVATILAAITVASRVRRALPGPVWIGIWAMLLTSIGAWLLGGNYSIPPLIWFLIGAADGAYKRLRDRGLLAGTLQA